MDLIRFGRSIRALRLRRRWRQQDLANAAELSRPMIARIEAGDASIPVGKLEKAAAAVGARTDLRVLWNGEALDRLLDAAHASLVDLVVRRLLAAGWEVATEVTFWIRGERGSVDILAFHAATAMLLVIEAKSVVPDVQATLAALDRKVRLAREIARERGWVPAAIGRLLVIGEDRTSRRRIASHAATFANAFPDRSVAVRRWIDGPDVAAPIRGLWFLSGARRVSTRHRVSRR